jgi:hypothetical protein
LSIDHALPKLDSVKLDCIANPVHQTMPYFELDKQETDSFRADCKHIVLYGPMALVRFTDSEAGHESASGKEVDPKWGVRKTYWMDVSAVEELLEDVSGPRPFGLAVVREVSKRWAVSDDWGNLQRVWVINIPAGKSVEAYVGTAMFQPTISHKKQADSRRYATSYYHGGERQYILGLTVAEKSWIRGPLRTLGLSRKKLLSKVTKG